MSFDKVEPLSNNDWFERHCTPKIDALKKEDSGYYAINIGLCYKRHEYVDEIKGNVRFSIFPMMVESPQKWTSNYGHAIRFLRALQAKIDSFNQPGAIIDLRLYISGASGCFKAFEYAYYNKQAKQGFEPFDTPESWMCKYMIWNSAIKTYEEESAIYERMNLIGRGQERLRMVLSERLNDAAIEKALDALVEVLNERPKDDNWMKKANQRKADLSLELRNYYGGSMPRSIDWARLAIERKVMRRLPNRYAKDVLPIWSKIRNDYLLNLASEEE